MYLESVLSERESEKYLSNTLYVQTMQSFDKSIKCHNDKDRPMSTSHP